MTGTLCVLTLGKALRWPPPQFPRPERSNWRKPDCLHHTFAKRFTPGNSFHLPPIPAPRADRPSAGGKSARGPRGGAVTRGGTPGPRPRRRRSARGASQVAPLLFYLPGCLFFAEYKEKRRREKGSGALLPAAGARSPCAQAARGGSRARPPSPTGAGPVAAPPRAALRLRCPRGRPSPRLPRARRV